MQSETVPVEFQCKGAELYGMLEVPRRPQAVGILVVVGGPQYRVGSHRQFALLCRALAAEGFAALRFDHRGVGDSEGSATFESLDPDISAAVQELTRRVPEVKKVVVWGLCDAASAAMIYGPKDPLITGLVLANPWIRDDSSMARTYVRHYYLKKVFSLDFWRRLITGKIKIMESGRSLKQTIHSAISGSVKHNGGENDTEPGPFQGRMRNGIGRFGGDILLILSGQDITAAEFESVAQSDNCWQAILRGPKITVKRLPDANHTFSRASWRAEVEAITLEWLKQCSDGS